MEIIPLIKFGERIADRRKVMKECLAEEKEEKEPIGETLTEPQFKDVVYTPQQEEFMKKIMEEIGKGNLIHLLFSGLAGTGKTYSGKMLACETKRPFVYLNGQMSQKKIRDMLLNLKQNALVLIDEIHNLPERVAETVYPAIEYNEISLDGKITKLHSNPLFIGTTTEPEQLPKPLQDRFFRIEFDEPDEEMVRKILSKMDLENEAVGHMINHSLNIRVLKKIIRLLDLYGGRTSSNLTKIFRMMKINLYSGLSEEQDRYIKHLKKVQKASVRALALVLRLSENRIKYDVEPELIKKGMIVITSRGRELAPDLVWDNIENLEKAEERIDNEPKFKEDSRVQARRYLKENPTIKDKFHTRYFELVSFIAQKIEEGVEPDLIDWESFGVDVSVEESFENNYKEDLHEL